MDSMSVRLRSRITTDGLDRTPHRAFMRAMGLDDEAIAKPMIGVVSQKGETVVFAPNPKKFEVIARNKLDGETTRASLVVSDGDLFIRTYKHLWCIAAKK